MNFDELNGKNRSLFGYFLAALSGAVLGGLLLLMFGPGTLFSRVPQSQPEVKSLGFVAADIKEVTTPQSISDIGLAASRVMPAVVGIIRPIEPENNGQAGAEGAEGTLIGNCADASIIFQLARNHATVFSSPAAKPVRGTYPISSLARSIEASLRLLRSQSRRGLNSTPAVFPVA